MPSGWVRLIMEKFNYSFDVIYSKDIDSGDLRSKYDVVLFVDDGIPAINSRNTQNNRSSNALDSIPEGLKRMTGRITVEKSIPQLKMFLEQGGNIVTIGSSTQLAYHLKLPVADAMVEIVNGEEKALVRDKFYTPGSILRMQVDNNQPATSGLNNEIDVYFDNNPVFKLNPDEVSSGIIQP